MSIVNVSNSSRESVWSDRGRDGIWRMDGGRARPTAAPCSHHDASVHSSSLSCSPLSIYYHLAAQLAGRPTKTSCRSLAWGNPFRLFARSGTAHWPARLLLASVSRTRSRGSCDDGAKTAPLSSQPGPPMGANSRSQSLSPRRPLRPSHPPETPASPQSVGRPFRGLL